GASTPVRRPEDFDLPEMVADVQAVVDQLELAPAIVGGGSMGAAVALAYALEAPEDFRALVLCAPALSHERHAAAGDFAAPGDRRPSLRPLASGRAREGDLRAYPALRADRAAERRRRVGAGTPRRGDRRDPRAPRGARRMTTRLPFLEARGITKRYEAVVALD